MLSAHRARHGIVAEKREQIWGFRMSAMGAVGWPVKTVVLIEIEYLFNQTWEGSLKCNHVVSHCWLLVLQKNNKVKTDLLIVFIIIIVIIIIPIIVVVVVVIEIEVKQGHHYPGVVNVDVWRGGVV